MKISKYLLLNLVFAISVTSCTIYPVDEQRQLPEEPTQTPPPHHHRQGHHEPNPHHAKKGNKTLQNEMLKRKWMLVEFKNFSRDKFVDNKAHVSFIQDDTTGKYNANFGCNSMFFSMNEMPGNKIEISNIGSTMMYCEGIMNLEMEAAKFLQDKLDYTITGHKLELKNKKGDIMRFVAEDWD